jgi:LacI family transcriptional regulator
MARPTIADVARAAGVSVSTVDRVLTGRHQVRPGTVARVLAAADTLGFRAAETARQRLGLDRSPLQLAFLLQQGSREFYRMLGAALTDATVAQLGPLSRPATLYMDDLTPSAVSDALLALGETAGAIAVVAADHPYVTRAVDQLRAKGVPVFTLISDLTAQGRAGFVGQDNWRVGRTAAWAVARLGKRPGKVGIVLGSHRYLCQETFEMGFRSYFREHAAEFELLEPVPSFEDPRFAYEATLDLLRREPSLVGLYCAGGGIEGVIQALREQGAPTYQEIVVACHEITDATRSGLIDGVLDIVLTVSMKALGLAAVQAMIAATESPWQERTTNILLPIEIFTSENP